MLLNCCGFVSVGQPCQNGIENIWILNNYSSGLHWILIQHSAGSHQWHVADGCTLI